MPPAMFRAALMNPQPLMTAKTGTANHRSQPPFPKRMTVMTLAHVTQMMSHMYSVRPGAFKSSPAVLSALVVGSYFGRPVDSRIYSQMKAGIERMI